MPRLSTGATDLDRNLATNNALGSLNLLLLVLNRERNFTLWLVHDMAWS